MISTLYTFMNSHTIQHVTKSNILKLYKIKCQIKTVFNMNHSGLEEEIKENCLSQGVL